MTRWRPDQIDVVQPHLHGVWTSPGDASPGPSYNRGLRLQQPLTHTGLREHLIMHS